MNDRFHIVHLSDLHLTISNTSLRKGDKKRNMNANCELILNSEPVQQADLIVITGDITDLGEIEAWNVFWSLVKKAKLDLKKLLVIYGNHDAACLNLVRSKTKKEYLKIARAGLALGQQPTTYPESFFFANGKGVAFTVDSVNSGSFSIVTHARGSIGGDQLKELEKLISKHSSVPCKLIVLHHSPNIPKRKTSKRRNEKPIKFWERPALRLNRSERRELRSFAKLYKTKAILHGHTHDNLDRRVNNVRIIGVKDSTVADRSEILVFKQYTYYCKSNILKSRYIKIPSV